MLKLKRQQEEEQEAEERMESMGEQQKDTHDFLAELRDSMDDFMQKTSDRLARIEGRLPAPKKQGGISSAFYNRSEPEPDLSLSSLPAAPAASGGRQPSARPYGASYA